MVEPIKPCPFCGMQPLSITSRGEVNCSEVNWGDGIRWQATDFIDGDGWYIGGQVLICGPIEQPKVPEV